MTRAVIAASIVAALAAAVAAGAARLPGVKSPTRNIRCFYVPIRPTSHGNLLCDIKHASYLQQAQNDCMARASLDWHGFTLPWNRRAQLTCAGGIMYDSRDTPTFVVLAYGRRWHYRGFACTSRITGLTCTNGHGHGLFLSRATWRGW